jgi:hypothetical protein
MRLIERVTNKGRETMNRKMNQAAAMMTLMALTAFAASSAHAEEENAARVVGTWELTGTMPNGAPAAMPMEVVKADKGFTGTMNTEIGKILITNIQVQGNKMTAKCDVRIDDMKVAVEFDGTLDGEKLQGTLKINVLGETMELPISGARKAL